MPVETPPSSLRGLGALVSLEQMASLMSARAPGLLDDREDLVVQIIRGVAAEVTAVVGSRFAATASPDALDLAVWAVTLGAAANLESSLFPEQSMGDDSRAMQLRVQYLGVRSDLTTYISGGQDTSSTNEAFTIRTRAQPYVVAPWGSCW